jgi:hypothetical protein
MWEPRRLTTIYASKACYRDSFIFYIYIYESEVWIYYVNLNYLKLEFVVWVFLKINVSERNGINYFLKEYCLSGCEGVLELSEQ